MDAAAGFWTVALLVVVALGYGFHNGVNDAAQAIAPAVSTGVLRPQEAVVFASLLHAAGGLLFPLAVAATVGAGLVDASHVSAGIAASALVAALAWMALTAAQGVPCSATHALVGGLLGASLAKSGPGSLDPVGVGATAAALLLAPALALVLGSLLMVGVAWLGRRRSPLRLDNAFRRAQLVSAAVHALARGGHGAQKTAGVIWMLLIAGGYAAATDARPPAWAAWGGYLALAAGTFVGGWRARRTMGQRLTKLKPVHAVAADTSAAVTLALATALGVPVSTTQTVTGAIVGVGSKRGASTARWGISRARLWVWMLTLPATAVLAAGAYALARWAS